MKFDQLAIHVNRLEEYHRLAMANACTVEDTVVARGRVFGSDLIENTARLAFNYSRWPMEFEVLFYERGDNWLSRPVNIRTRTYRSSGLSHYGMNLPDQRAMLEWKEKLGRHKVAQEVVTLSHKNEVIAGKRWYHYVVYDTYQEMGADIKLILRLNSEEERDAALAAL